MKKLFMFLMLIAGFVVVGVDVEAATLEAPDGYTVLSTKKNSTAQKAGVLFCTKNEYISSYGKVPTEENTTTTDYDDENSIGVSDIEGYYDSISNEKLTVLEGCRGTEVVIYPVIAKGKSGKIVGKSFTLANSLDKKYITVTHRGTIRFKKVSSSAIKIKCTATYRYKGKNRTYSAVVKAKCKSNDSCFSNGDGFSCYLVSCTVNNAGRVLQNDFSCNGYTTASKGQVNSAIGSDSIREMCRKIGYSKKRNTLYVVKVCAKCNRMKKSYSVFSPHSKDTNSTTDKYRWYGTSVAVNPTYRHSEVIDDSWNGGFDASSCGFICNEVGSGGNGVRTITNVDSSGEWVISGEYTVDGNKVKIETLKLPKPLFTKTTMYKCRYCGESMGSKTSNKVSVTSMLSGANLTKYICKQAGIPVYDGVNLGGISIK